MCVQDVRLNERHPDLDIYKIVFSLANMPEELWQMESSIPLLL